MKYNTEASTLGEAFGMPESRIEELQTKCSELGNEIFSDPEFSSHTVCSKISSLAENDNELLFVIYLSGYNIGRIKEQQEQQEQPTVNLIFSLPKEEDEQ